jgi:uncharacterized membrane protein YGL010W
MKQLLQNYHESHRHPFNRFTHAIGIPLIAISLPLFFFRWKWGLGIFLLGWFFQILGHWVEGKPPAFLKDPVYLLVGPAWLIKKIIGRTKGDD